MFGLVTGVWAACGGDSAGPVSPPPPPPNRAPTAVGTLPAVRVAVGEASEVQLAGGFNDPDGDALSYAAVTSNADVATVAVVGSVATVTGVAKGVATISVTATDPGGASARQVFEATVPNRAPETSRTIKAIELAVGETETLDVSQYFSEPDGDALSYSVVSSDTTSVTAVASGNAVTVTAVAAGTATITVTATDTDAASAEQSFDVTVPNRAPEPTDTIPDQELAVGDSAVFELQDYFSDPDGDTLTYTSASSDEAVATATVSGSTLTIRALAKGSATISVTVADLAGLTVSDSFDVTVPNRAPVVTDSIPAQRLTVGETGAWAGSEFFSDPDGDVLTYAAGTTDAAIVLVIVSGGDFGIVAVSPGTAMVTVTATDGDGLSASQGFEVVVRAEGAVRITDVEPAVWLEGAPATIRGSGFSPIPANNTVVIDGLAAVVNEATSTSLSITVPHADCLPPRQAELRVTAGGSSDARTVGVTPRSREDLDLPPGFYKLALAGNACLHLPGDASGGDYLIGVVSTSEVPSSLTSVTLTGTPGDATILAGAATATATAYRDQIVRAAGLSAAGFPPVAASTMSGTDTPPREQSAAPPRDWALHNEIMAANEEVLRRLGSLPPAMARAQQSRALAANDTVTLFSGFLLDCSERDQVRAVVRLVGDNAVWLDDIENPSGTFTDSELAELDAFYASHVRGVHDDYYGSLSDVDGDGKLRILMTKDANRQNAGGWVSFWDLLPPEQCGTSNHSEIFYGQVPDPDGVLGYVVTKEQLVEFYPSLIAHEVTHLIQGNAALFQGGRFTSWELEGGAVLSEELVGYRVFGHDSGRDLGHAEWDGRGEWYHWVAGLARFFGWDSDDETGRRRVPYAPEQCSWIGRTEEGNDGPCRDPIRAVYDVPSLLYRYALDRWGADYAGGERALMRDFSRSPEIGLASLAKASGWPVEQVLADFYIAVWADLNVGDAAGMRSWDLADLWTRFYESAWLRPYSSTSAAFQEEWRVRAGSTFYLRWTPGGARGPTSLKVASPDGFPAPAHMSVWALRLR